MILSIFGLIALLSGGTTALALLIAKRVRERKERGCTGQTVGTVVRYRRGSVDRCARGHPGARSVPAERPVECDPRGQRRIDERVG